MGKPITHEFTQGKTILKFFDYKGAACVVPELGVVADANGNKISYDVPLIANVRDADARKRVMNEKFTLKSGKYSRSEDYFLVLADMDDERVEHQRYKFEIDIIDML